MDEVEVDDGGKVTRSEKLEKQPKIGSEKCEDQLGVQVDQEMTEMNKAKGKEMLEEQPTDSQVRNRRGI